MSRDTIVINWNDVPDHSVHEVQLVCEKLMEAIAPFMTTREGMNHSIGALSWVTFLLIKEFVADHHHEKAVANFAFSILKNMETYKDRNFTEESRRKNDPNGR